MLKCSVVLLLLQLLSSWVCLILSEHSCGKQNDGLQCHLEQKWSDQIADKQSAYKYTEVASEHHSHLQQIFDAQRSFSPCNSNCSCHYTQIKADLKPYVAGISKDMIDDSRSRGTLYQILDGKVYREERCMFPSRCAGVEHFLIEVADKLPNTEFVVNVRDWPQVNAHHGSADKLPVFSFSKQEGVHSDILYPAWSFWEGGPAISLHPTGLGRWDLRRKTITKAANKWKWNQKIEKAFFRGSRTSSHRDGIVLLSRSKPQLADARYTKNQAWKSEKDTLNAPPAHEVSLENHCEYKYLFNFHGVAASFRFKHLFLCGSLVFHEISGWIEFFYPQMKPWIHYVPVPAQSSKDDIENLLLFTRENDGHMRQIARAGHDFINERLRMADVRCYWKKLLKTYTKLLRYEPELRNDVNLVLRKQ